MSNKAVLSIPPWHAAPRIASDTPNGNQSGRGLMEQMLIAECRLAYVARQTTTLFRDKDQATSEQIVSRNREQAIKIVYLSGAVCGEQIVDDGTTFWHFTPARNTLAVGPSRMQRKHKRICDLLQKIKQGTLSVQITGQETIAGRVCDIVDVRQISGIGPWRRLWLDRDSHVQLKGEEYRLDGTLQSESEYTQFGLVDGFPPGTFGAPVTPPNVTRVPADIPHTTTIKEAQSQVDFPIRLPGSLPACYSFQSAQVTQFRSQNMVVLRYANGLNLLSIYEMQSDPIDKSRSVFAPRSDVVLATVAGLKLVVVGNQGTDVLQQVLNSLR